MRQAHRVSSDRPAAERPFVDREEPIAIFQAALNAPQRAKPLVLVFHGGAGTGKSRLRRELVKLVDSRQHSVDGRQETGDGAVVTATLDFDVPVHRQPDAALLFLRQAIGEACKAEFPSFDIAYAVLWQKAHPDAPMGLPPLSAAENGGCTQQGTATAPCEELRPLLEPGSLLSQLLDETGRLPLIGLIPKIANTLRDQGIEGPRDRVKEAPTSNLLSTTYYLSWRKERGERELEDLPQMEPAAIVEQLPKLWASDLRDYLRQGSRESGLGSGQTSNDSPLSTPHSRSAVLFIDSYEKLWGMGDEGRRTRDEGQKTDAWVRELVKELPEALWVISGRQKLRWEEVEKEWADVLSQHELGPLPEHSARQFLSGCGITDEPIQDAIAKGSQGLPHYLNLAVDTFQEIEQAGKRAGSVQPLFSEAESSDSPEQMFEQFIRHLDQPEIETLQVLSASRFWNYGLFEHLVTEYQTGYPLTSYDDLSRFSFVGEGAAPETRTMHDLMREALQEHQAPELRKRVHLFLHEYYTKQLEGLDVKNITDRHKAALNEAFYHGRQAMSAEELWSWVDAAQHVFQRAGQFRLLIPLCREAVQALETELGPNHAAVATALWHLAWTLRRLGEYDQAEELLRRSLSIAEVGQGPEHKNHMDFLHELSLALDAQGRYAEAEALGRRMVAMREGRPGNDAVGRAPILGLARALIHQRKYAEAEELLRRELALLGPDDGGTISYSDSLAELLETQHRFSEALVINRRLLAGDERRFGPRHPDVASAMGNVATNLYKLGRFDEAEPLLRRVLQLKEEVCGPEHDSTAATMNNLACLLADQGQYAEAEPMLRRAMAVFEKKMGPDHSRTLRMAGDLIRVLVERGNYGEAEPMVLSTIAAREKKFGPDHPEVASPVHWAGVMYRDQGRYEEADGYLRRALDIRTRTLGPEHWQTLTSVDALALLDDRRGRHAEAESAYRDALQKRERVQGPEHPDVADTANRLAGICCRDGRYAEAEALYRRALATREKVFGSDHSSVAETLEGLAKVCEQTGRVAEAQELAIRAQHIRAQAEAAPTNPQQQA